MNDELLARLRRVDPSPDHVPVHPSDGPLARTLEETIMNTTPLTDPVPSATARPRRPRRLALAGGALAAVAAGGALALGALGGGSPTSVTYGVPASDPMAMCLTISEYVPDPGAAAFAGRVTSLGATSVTLDVDRWFTGGDADEVVLEIDEATTEVALDGVAFAEGEEMLVTVIDDTVAICGISGPATPELQAYYATWYG